ncbi:hypothetical protein OCE25_26095 [Bacillus cereus]|nr:hypothetical protein [Bacillus cereus]
MGINQQELDKVESFTYLVLFAEERFPYETKKNIKKCHEVFMCASGSFCVRKTFVVGNHEPYGRNDKAFIGNDEVRSSSARIFEIILMKLVKES